MTPFLLPVFPDDANYQVEVALDGVVFRLRYKYNARDESWYISILDEAGVLLRSSLRLVEAYPVMRSFVGNNRPAGEIIIVPTQNFRRPPKLGELGEDFVPLYFGES